MQHVQKNSLLNQLSLKKCNSFPGGPVIKTALLTQDMRVRSMVGELRFCVWWNMAKNFFINKNKRNVIPFSLRFFFFIEVILRHFFLTQYNLLSIYFFTEVISCMYTTLLEKEMATHSSILAWKIPWTEEPDGLWSMGSQRVTQDWTHMYKVYLF